LTFDFAHQYFLTPEKHDSLQPVMTPPVAQPASVLSFHDQKATVQLCDTSLFCLQDLIKGLNKKRHVFLHLKNQSKQSVVIINEVYGQLVLYQITHGHTDLKYCHQLKDERTHQMPLSLLYMLLKAVLPSD